MISHDLMITVVGAVLLGVMAQVLAERLRIPSIIFLLAFGVVCGPDGMNLIRPSLLGEGLFALTAVSVAIILFEGGLTLELRNVRHVSTSVMNLITIGAAITWLGAAICSWWILDISWTLAVLFGSLVIVTGPTVIGPLLRTVRVSKGVTTILKWEGMLIDPVGAIVAVLLLGFVVSEESTFLGTLGGFAGRILTGAVLGVVGGLVLSFLLRMRLTETTKTLVIFAGVLVTYGASELLLRESGIMSVTAAGITMGNLKGPNLQNIKGFKEKLTILLVSCLFVLLAANLRLSEVQAIGWAGVLVVCCLMFIVRPLNVWVSVRDRSISVKEKLFLSWIAPRGIVAAAVASLFSLTLEQEGYPNASLLASLTFLTIAITVFFQGITAYPLAKQLSILQARSSGVLILGGNELALGMARVFGAHGIPVAVVDSNSANCTEAGARNIAATCADILDDDVWDQIDMTAIGTFLAATENNELNSLACGRASDIFGNDNVFQLRHSYPGEHNPFTLSMIRGNQTYDLSLDIASVSDDLRTGRSQVEAFSSNQRETNPSQQEIILCGLGKSGVVFSTQKGVLAGAEYSVRLRTSEQAASRTTVA